MADQRRIQRLEQVILRTLGPVISQGLADPRLGVVTVTRIKLSRDLGIARVNWSCMGSDSDRSRAEHALSHARGHMQSAVAKAMRTRTTPHLQFHYDPSLENSVRINDLLHQLKLERGETDEDDVEGEGTGDQDIGDQDIGDQDIGDQGTEEESTEQEAGDGSDETTSDGPAQDEPVQDETQPEESAPEEPQPGDV
jgi:ribosome-binding factor A